MVSVRPSFLLAEPCVSSCFQYNKTMSEWKKTKQAEKTACQRQHKEAALRKQQLKFYKRHQDEDGLYRFMRRFKLKEANAVKRLAELGCTTTRKQRMFARTKKEAIHQQRQEHKEKRQCRLAIREESCFWEEWHQEAQEYERISQEDKQRREVLEALDLDMEDILTIEGKDLPF